MAFLKFEKLKRKKFHSFCPEFRENPTECSDKLLIIHNLYHRSHYTRNNDYSILSDNFFTVQFNENLIMRL